MGTPKDSLKTRAKIIDAAGKLFAEKGFKAVTVREIAIAANTHLSALNYHFNTKTELYRHVVLAACKSDAATPTEKKMLRMMPPAIALKTIIGETLKSYRSASSDCWQCVLITRESHASGALFPELVEQYIKPESDFLAEIVAACANTIPDNPNVTFAVVTLMALLETFGLYEHLVESVSENHLAILKTNHNLTQKIFKQVIHAAAGN